MWDIVIRYVHFLGIIMLSASLIVEHLLLHKSVSRQQFKRLLSSDLTYGVSAVLVLGSGLLMWLVVGKPAEFYTTNGLFHIKLTLFVLIALFSIYPTIFFIKNRRKTSDPVEIPARIILLLRLELALLVLMPLLGVLIARGQGLS